MVLLSGQAVAEVVLSSFTFTAPETLTDGTYIIWAKAKTADGSSSINLSLLSDSVTDKPAFEDFR